MLSRLSASLVDDPAILALGVAGSAQTRVATSEFNYKKGVEVYGEKEPADYVYQVVSGAVRSYKLLSDGRRQIGAFHLTSDIFGLENSNVLDSPLKRSSTPRCGW
jgi:CRP/FNR family nitrogen fixation transcriptional regulator